MAGYTVITTKDQQKALVNIINQKLPQAVVTNANWEITTYDTDTQVKQFLQSNSIDYSATHQLVFVPND